MKHGTVARERGKKGVDVGENGLCGEREREKRGIMERSGELRRNSQAVRRNVRDSLTGAGERRDRERRVRNLGDDFREPIESVRGCTIDSSTPIGRLGVTDTEGPVIEPRRARAKRAAATDR